MNDKKALQNIPATGLYAERDVAILQNLTSVNDKVTATHTTQGAMKRGKAACLNREFKITSEAALTGAINFIKSNWKPLLEAETPIFVHVTNTEEKRRDIANRYYWAVVIRSIVEQSWVHGRQYSPESWHELLAGMYGIRKDVTLPDGNVVSKRLSTTEMKVREFAEYTEMVLAYGATELGVRFPADPNSY